jgi:nucleotide-binding universal stress UspA family protein
MLSVGPGLESYETEVREARERVTRVSDDAVARLDAAGRSARGTVRDGDPAGVILAAAESSAVDLIVVGTHGRTGLDRLMLGSVARAVLMHAHTSVLVAHHSRFGHGREYTASDPAQLAAAGHTR